LSNECLELEESLKTALAGFSLVWGVSSVEFAAAAYSVNNCGNKVVVDYRHLENKRHYPRSSCLQPACRHGELIPFRTLGLEYQAYRFIRTDSGMWANRSSMFLIPMDFNIWTSSS